MRRRSRRVDGRLPTVRSGRFRVSRIRQEGRDPVRLLLVADLTDLGDELLTPQQRIEQFVDGVGAASGRGVELDVIGGFMAAISAFTTTSRHVWQAWRFDAVLLMPPAVLTARQRATLAAATRLVDGLAPVCLIEAVDREATDLIGIPAVSSRCRSVDPRELVRATMAVTAPVAIAVILAPHPPLDDFARFADRRLAPLTVMAARTYDLPHAEISLLSGETLTTVASTGGTVGARLPAGALCYQAIIDDCLRVVGDAWYGPARGPEPGLRFCAAVPLHDSTGDRIGSMCVWDERPHDPGGFEYATLTEIALLAEAELAHA